MLPKQVPERVPKLNLFWEPFCEPPGTLLAPFRAPFWGPFCYLLRSDFSLIFCGFRDPFWAPFWLHFGVVLTSKIYAKSCRKFDAVLGWIWGAPGDPQARKVWFSLSKTMVFKGPPVLANEREARKKRKSCNRTCEYAESVPELLKQS